MSVEALTLTCRDREDHYLLEFSPPINKANISLAVAYVSVNGIFPRHEFDPETRLVTGLGYSKRHCQDDIEMRRWATSFAQHLQDNPWPLGPKLDVIFEDIVRR